jgi:hypothetical protein
MMFRKLVLRSPVNINSHSFRELDAAAGWAFIERAPGVVAVHADHGTVFIPWADIAPSPVALQGAPGEAPTPDPLPTPSPTSRKRSK